MFYLKYTKSEIFLGKILFAENIFKNNFFPKKKKIVVFIKLIQTVTSTIPDYAAVTCCNYIGMTSALHEREVNCKKKSFQKSMKILLKEKRRVICFQRNTTLQRNKDLNSTQCLSRIPIYARQSILTILSTLEWLEKRRKINVVPVSRKNAS